MNKFQARVALTKVKKAKNASPSESEMSEDQRLAAETRPAAVLLKKEIKALRRQAFLDAKATGRDCSRRLVSRRADPRSYESYGSE